MKPTLKKIKNFLILPPLDTEFEDCFLRRMNAISLYVLVTHLPVFILLAWLNETGVILATVLTSFALVGPFAATLGLKSLRAISVVMGISSMFMGGILVHLGQGPVQIEMHFYFFVMLALLAVYGNPMVIVAAATTVSLHHLILWALLPSSVFNYSAPLWIVAVHAGFVIMESAAACFIARGFFDSTIQLEKRVALRTAEVTSANREIRELLDSVQQGFLKIDCFGRLGNKFSKAVIDLLGEIPDSKLFTDLLARHDLSTSEWFALGLEDVFAGIMPLELTLDQLPKQIRSTNRILSLEYLPVFDEKELVNVVVVISDITALTEREQLEVENREFLAIIDRMTADQIAFLDFIAEAELLVNKIRDRSSELNDEIKRDIHTLKGNASIFGLTRLTRTCESLEDHIAESNELPPSALWTELFQAWASTRGYLQRLMADTEVKITLCEDEHSAVLLGILENRPRAQLATRIATWRLEPTRRRLESISEQVGSLGVKLAKENLKVLVEDHGLRTDPRYWSKFWSTLIHVIRNSVDHGIETFAERLQGNKITNGTITLATIVEDDRYVVSVKDDGRGINWDSIRIAAQRRGLPCATELDLKEALFQVGVSTCKSITETSGRGVGMAAVRESCRLLGGTIEIHSQLGIGTEFRFVFPVDRMAPDMHDLLKQHGVTNPHAISCNTVTF